MKKRPYKSYLNIFLCIGILSTFIYIELYIGASNTFDINKYWLHNVIICFLINTFIFGIFRNRKVLLIVSVIAFLWSMISHFVLELHGSALCFSLFKSFKTAITVIDNYHITFDLTVLLIIVVFVINLTIIFMIPQKYIDEYYSAEPNWMLKALFIVVFALYAYFSFSIAKQNFSWAPFFVIEQRGYCSYLITDGIFCFDHISKPDGYDDNLIPTNLTGWDDNVSDINPDIIVILNESFSDITQYSNVLTDVDPLEELQLIENLTMGYCIVPNAGGGTNISEYELLTSNSSSLLSIDAPFNYINFEKHNESIVPYLEANSYSTYAFHCFSKENYNRKIAYASMGFDNIYLGPDQYRFHNKNGYRDWLDEDNYNELIEIYNESPDKPKFMFLLTYQNHGGYEQNPSEMDTIHSIGEYDVSNDIIDEYESSLALSTNAFKNLTDYFATVNRPVIICMLGDHTASFSSALNNTPSSKDKKEIENRTVPYLIWSNYSIDRKIFTQYTSVIDLMPSVLYAAGIELDDYYKQILDLHEVLPGKTTFGLYIDNTGTVHSISDSKEANDAWKFYLFSEYKRLTG